MRRNCVNGPYKFVLMLIAKQKNVKLYQSGPRETLRAPED